MASERKASSHGVEVERLYQLPLDEFTAARNELAKQVGRADAPAVRALAKPNILAWALNQLYWSRRETFDRLVAGAARLRTAQAQALMGKPSDMRSAGEQHREALRVALKETTGILEAAGHGVTPDAIRELTGALEALPWSEPAGRLTRPPVASGFGALAGMVSSVGQSSSFAKGVGQSSSFAKGVGQSSSFAQHARPSDAGPSSGLADQRREAALESARAAAAAARREEADAAAHLTKAEANVEAARQRERAAREALAVTERARSTAEQQGTAAARALDAARRAVGDADRRLADLEGRKG